MNDFSYPQVKEEPPPLVGYEAPVTSKIFKDSYANARSTMTTSASKYPREQLASRNRMVDDAVKDGTILPEVVEFYDGDHGLMAWWANKYRGSNFVLDEELIERKKKILADQSESLGKQLEHATWGQKATSMVGTMAGASVSIDTGIALVFGGGGVLTQGLKIANQFRNAAILGASLETLRQMQVNDVNKTLRIPYSAKEMWANIAFNTTGEVIGVGMTALPRWLTLKTANKMLDKAYKDLDYNMTIKQSAELDNLRMNINAGLTKDPIEAVSKLQRVADSLEEFNAGKTGPRDAAAVNNDVLSKRLEELKQGVLHAPDNKLLLDEIAEIETFQKAQPKFTEEPKIPKQAEGGTAHPGSEHLDDAEDAAWLANSKHKDAAEARVAVEESGGIIDEMTDCLISNGISPI